jgi:hypothetical protein
MPLAAHSARYECSPFSQRNTSWALAPMVIVGEWVGEREDIVIIEYLRREVIIRVNVERGGRIESRIDDLNSYAISIVVYYRMYVWRNSASL